ncbi:FbpB family small basic protein [Bacillaceae bacterium SIJ1]|nr:FbpB family small basic protein [Litoribacterium kuwaitense]NGP44434.1 FbpB family small basic protein [Litoribacterium kuwaitense]
MRRRRNLSFKELVSENKESLLLDKEEMERLEKRLEDKAAKYNTNKTG